MTLSALRELAAALSRLRASGGRGAVATLLEVKGRSASRPGSRVLLTDEEQLVGEVTLGGCAGPHLLQTLREVRDTGTPQPLTLSLGDESYEFGLTCTAQLELFIQPCDLGAEDVYLAVLEMLKAGRRAGLITYKNGLQRVFDLDEMPPSLAPAVQAAAHTLSHADPKANSACLYEGERPAALLERFLPPPHLIIVGAGGVAVALAKLAYTLDFRVTVTDTEPLRLTQERFPHAERHCVPGVEAAFNAHSFGPDDYLVLTSHNYADEVSALQGAVSSDVSYIGLVASRRRGKAVLSFLEQLGISPLQLARVDTPAGLDLGAVTPAEIAVSIISKLLAVRTSHSGDSTVQPVNQHPSLMSAI